MMAMDKWTEAAMSLLDRFIVEAEAMHQEAIQASLRCTETRLSTQRRTSLLILSF